MIEYNEVMLTALLGLSATVYGLIEVAKPLIKPALRKAKVADVTYPIIWQVVGVVLGIIAVIVVGTEDVSFLRMWNIVPVDVPEAVDVVLTGVMVGLGDRAVHWFLDWIQDNGEAVSKWLKLLSGANS